MSNIQIKILLIEDDFGDADLFSQCLREVKSLNYKLCHARELSEAKELFLSDSFDIAFLDLNLPDSTGLDTLEMINKVSNRTPIIVLTGLDDEELALKAIFNGAQDYINKWQLNESLLSRLINFSIERNKSIQGQTKERNNLEKKLAERTAELIKENKKRIKSERQLKERNEQLRDVLEQISIDKKNLRSKILEDLSENARPNLLVLKKIDDKRVQTAVNNIEELFHSTSQKKSNRLSDSLTPAELEICELITAGHDSKSIAKIKNITFRTAQLHRYNIRKKLGLQNKSINLVSYLKNL